MVNLSRLKSTIFLAQTLCLIYVKTMKSATMQQEKRATSPLDTLSAALEDDMKSVSALIIQHMQSDVAMIPQLASYLIAAGGKRVRPLLTLASTALFDGNMRRAHGLAAAVEFIHTATLLHDDVVDDSDQRRGKPAANVVFGNEASVLVGDFLFSRAFQLMVADGNLEILRILSGASATIAEGEVLQLSTQNNIATGWDDYLKVIEGKTAALFAAACEVGPVIAGQNEETASTMYDFGMKLGTAFQIVDDVLDYSADQEALGKTVGDDFREGKMSAPVILALKHANAEEKEFWIRTIENGDQKDGDFEQAQTYIQNHKIIEEGLEKAQTFARDAQSLLPGNTPFSLYLHDLCDYTITRAY